MTDQLDTLALELREVTHARKELVQREKFLKESINELLGEGVRDQAFRKKFQGFELIRNRARLDVEVIDEKLIPSNLFNRVVDKKTVKELYESTGHPPDGTRIVLKTGSVLIREDVNGKP